MGIRAVWSAALAALLATGGVTARAEPPPGAVPPTEPEPTEPEPTGPEPTPEPARPAEASPPADTAASGPPPPAELTAREVAGAPRPDAARNLVRDDRSGARHLLWVPRVVLFVPRWTLWIAAAPVRGGLYAFEYYGLNERLRRLLSGDGPVAVYPSVARESGHGLTYGVGAGVRRWVRGNFLFAGEVRQVYDLRLRSDKLLGEELELELAGQIQLLDDALFFGIGNRDLEAPPMPGGVDPRAAAVATRFDQQIVRGELVGAWRPRPWLTARATAAAADKDFDRIDDPEDGRVDLAAVYDPARLVGFADGVHQGYGELRAIVDDRAATNPFASLAQPATGWKLEGFAGYARGFAGDPTDTLRYGLDVQRYLDLYFGDRVLVLRAYLEGVTADVDDIPFSELPRLGGSRLMRGYPRNRFRDRAVTAFSVEYRYPISRTLSAFTFLDGGGAWRTLADFDPRELHPGYGAGVQLHTAELFLTRFLVAGGDDGVTFYLSFTPSSELQLTTHQW